MSTSIALIQILSTFLVQANHAGVVMDGGSRKPLAGVAVSLGATSKSTSDAAGRFYFGDSLSGLGSRGSVRELAAGADWEMFDLEGRLLARATSAEELGARMREGSGGRLRPVLVRQRGFGAGSTWKGLVGSPLFPIPGPGVALERSLSVDDTLVASRSGFDTVKVAVASGTYRLDTLWMPPAGSGANPSWNLAAIVDSIVDARDGRSYRVVRVGKQRWLASNLNYKPEGADTGWCWNNKLNSCVKYGRYYAWGQAMARQPALVGMPRPAQGLCPAGWHLPSSDEVNELIEFIGGTAKGWRLKSVGGWLPFLQGSDDYGFRLLPGGMTGGHFVFAGERAEFWTSTPLPEAPAILAVAVDETIGRTSELASNGLNVRCIEGVVGRPHDTLLRNLVITAESGKLDPAFKPEIQVYADTVSWAETFVTVAANLLDTSSRIWIQGVEGRMKAADLGDPGTTTVVPVVVKATDGDSLVYSVSLHRLPKPSDFSIPWNDSITFGTLVDARDSKAYRTVTLGVKTWMAENLQFKPATADSGICPGESVDSCAKYGRFYSQPIALAGGPRTSANPSTTQGICPTGWHLPSSGEWYNIATFTGPLMTAETFKSTTGWETTGSGVDTYGFRALPSGAVTAGTWTSRGSAAQWWTSTAGNTEEYGFCRELRNNTGSLQVSNCIATMNLPVRCVKN